jgi:tetrapyrrole methylase family protein/MazG family protein
VLERSVDHLVAAAGQPGTDVEVDVQPALSFLDLAWVRLGIDPLEEGARLVDGHRFAAQAAGERGPLLVAHVHNQRVLSDIKLAVDLPDEPVVTVLQRLGGTEETISQVAWSDLDRTVEADHLTSLWIPRLAEPIAGELAAFAELVTTLRESCPWDREQTHQSLTRYLLEEAYEVLEAIDELPVGATGTDPAYAHLEDELGDLLFQVVFHAKLASEVGAFTLADVARGINDKLVRRHPHVFAGASSELADINRRWEDIKRDERGGTGPMDAIPATLPSVLYAAKVLRRAASAGHPWTPDPAAAALGDRLLALVAEALSGGIDPETALRHAADRVRDAAARDL